MQMKLKLKTKNSNNADNKNKDKNKNKNNNENDINEINSTFKCNNAHNFEECIRGVYYANLIVEYRMVLQSLRHFDDSWILQQLMKEYGGKHNIQKKVDQLREVISQFNQQHNIRNDAFNNDQIL